MGFEKPVELYCIRLVSPGRPQAHVRAILFPPLSSTANFTSYTFPRFGRADQQRLQQVVVALAGRGCHVLLSNSTAADIVALYETNTETRAVGLRTLRVPARRAINSNAARRGPVDEYLITNCRRAEA